MKPIEVDNFILEGRRPPVPEALEHAAAIVIMESCWAEVNEHFIDQEKRQRPTFATLVDKFDFHEARLLPAAATPVSERRRFWTTNASEKNYRLVDETAKLGKLFEQLMMETSLFVPEGAAQPGTLPSPSTVQVGKSGSFKFIVGGRYVDARLNW